MNFKEKLIESYKWIAFLDNKKYQYNDSDGLKCNFIEKYYDQEYFGSIEYAIERIVNGDQFNYFLMLDEFKFNKDFLLKLAKKLENNNHLLDLIPPFARDNEIIEKYLSISQLENIPVRFILENPKIFMNFLNKHSNYSIHMNDFSKELLDIFGDNQKDFIKNFEIYSNISDYDNFNPKINILRKKVDDVFCRDIEFTYPNYLEDINNNPKLKIWMNKKEEIKNNDVFYFLVFSKNGDIKIEESRFDEANFVNNKYIIQNSMIKKITGSDFITLKKEELYPDYTECYYSAKKYLEEDYKNKLKNLADSKTHKRNKR